MPITLTFDIENASIADTNVRTRIIACFQRFGWEHTLRHERRYIVDKAGIALILVKHSAGKRQLLVQ